MKLKLIFLLVLRVDIIIFYIVKKCGYLLLDNVSWMLLAEVGERTKIHPTAILRQSKNIKIGLNCMVNAGNVLQAGYEDGKIILGDYTQLGAGVKIFAYEHKYRDKSVPSIQQGYREKSVIIGSNVWIGAGAVILSGTRIEDDCVVAAGSVVKGEFTRGSLIKGTLAK